MSRHTSVLAALIVSALLSASATQIKVRTIEQLAALGETVVHGTVTSKTCQRDSEGRIFTRVQLKVKEYWKGSRPVDSIIHSGGVLGDEAVFADGQEHYAVGEEVVAFVRFNHRGDALTVGMAQGKFNVFKHGEETLAHNAFHGASPPERATGQGRKPLTLPELKARVQRGAP